MATTYVRSYNPVWYLPDLVGEPLNDEYYMFTLQPTLPYLPQQIYRDSAGNTFWPAAIQFQDGGTLPENMYWDPNAVYRLEIRHGNTQNDPLVYEINNYYPGGQGGGGDVTIDLLPDNQFTNPQFSTVLFYDSYTISSAGTYPIAPGWDLVVSGVGSTVVSQRIYTGSQKTATDNVPPYALRFVSSGWSSATLRQRLSGNGGIWSLGALAFAGTFTSTVSAKAISVNYVPSTGAATTLMSDTTTVGTFTELSGAAEIPQSTNITANDLAYVDINIVLPTDGQVEVGNCQLVAQNEPVQVSFSESTIERQIDQTFHYYKDSILLMPKESLLTGWNFGQNPWQFTDTASATVTSAIPIYTADQTIVATQRGIASAAGSNVAVGRATAANRYGLQVTAVNASNQFALIQFIDPATIRPYWGHKLSCLVKCRLVTTHGSEVPIKARLIASASLPATLGAATPIATWVAATTPTFAAQYNSVVTPLGDPVYTIDGSAELQFLFPDFQNVNASSADMTLGIVIYTNDDMDESATADSIIFDEISLVVNDFPIATPVMSFDETLRRCQYYYEKSYPLDVMAGTLTTNGQVIFGNWDMNHTAFGQWNTARRPVFLDYSTIKRANPTMVFYSPTSATPNRIRIFAAETSGIIVTSDVSANFVDSPGWTLVGQTNKNVSYLPNETGYINTGAIVAPTYQATSFHYTANARLGE